MSKLLNPLLFLLVDATRHQLIAQIELLKAENRMLRSRLPKRVDVTASERRRLVELGEQLGAGVIKHLISIVHPRTFARWISENKSGPASQASSLRRRGRPGKPEWLRELVVRMATENAWGYTRILGELRKLGIIDISRGTIANILKAEGIEPAPRRSTGRWRDFVKRHAETLWACDFLSKRIMTLRGPRQFFVLFFIHLASRRVIVCPATDRPDAEWMREQAAYFLEQMKHLGLTITHLIRDHDGKFKGGFDDEIKRDGAEVIRVGPCAPNLNAFAERWVRSIKEECLSHFIVIGQTHLNYLISEFVDHYHLERPHQGLDNGLIDGPTRPPPAPDIETPIECEERLGGLLTHYRRAA